MAAWQPAGGRVPAERSARKQSLPRDGMPPDLARPSPNKATPTVMRYSQPMRELAHLPKAHLHLHLDGAMRRETYAELAAARGLAAPLPTSFGSFDDFGETIVAAARVLDDPAVVERALDEILADAARDGVVWLELSVWPGLFAGRLGSDLKAIDVVLLAGRRAAARHGVGFGLVVAANRDRGTDEALHVAQVAASRASWGVTGFGLDGDEAACPPAPFAAAFGIARAAGLQAVPHAGELAGADSVGAALDLLGATRIMHGVRAIEDEDLTRRLVASGVCLDVCPTSNVLLGVASSLETHPLPALLASGVRCSLNADDPLPFDVSILDEYERCRSRMGLDDAQLADIARTSLFRRKHDTVKRIDEGTKWRA
jgi:adenosine deaminase